MTPRLLALLLALAALTWSACLESGRNGMTGDVADTTTTDAGCEADSACDDGDPCTWDECVVATGECRHWEAPYGAREQPYAECQQDSECDDGDPCTADYCELGPDGCGYGAVCVHEETPGDGCYGCKQTGCADANPCTTDLCQDDGTCAFVPSEDCAFACNGTNLTSHTTALYSSSYGAAVKLAGFVRPDFETVCLDGGCQCSGMPALADEGGEQIGLRPLPSTNGDDSAWYCRYDYCVNETPACAPLQYDALYWVWGTITDRYSYAYSGAEYPGDAPGAPRQPMDVLDVWDYCLQTNAAGLVGRYAGTYTTQAYPGVSYDLEAVIFVDAGDGQLKITLSEPDCPSCGQTAIAGLFPYTTAVTTGDGWLSFEMVSPAICNAIVPPPFARLESRKSVLTGVYHEPLLGGDGDSDGDVSYCAYGELTLSRLP